jgi:hypothetical protein
MVQQAEGPRLWHRRRRKWNRRADLHASHERHDQPLRHIMDLRHPLHNSIRRQHDLCPPNPQPEPHSRHETSCDQQNAFPSSGVLASSLLGLSEHPRVRGSALLSPRLCKQHWFNCAARHCCSSPIESRTGCRQACNRILLGWGGQDQHGKYHVTDMWGTVPGNVDPRKGLWGSSCIFALRCSNWDFLDCKSPL